MVYFNDLLQINVRTSFIYFHYFKIETKDFNIEIKSFKIEPKGLFYFGNI